MNLLEPQINHADALINSLYINGFAFDLSDTGTGKTYCACSIIKEMDRPTIVICPKSVMTNWSRVSQSWNLKNVIILNYELLVRGNTKYLKYNKKKWNVRYKNWNDRGVELSFPKNALIIFDEVHKCKGYNSLNGELLIACKNAGHFVLAMSATAVTNPLEMKAIGYTADLHNGVNFKEFVKGCGAETNRFGGLVVNLDSDATKAAMQQIHNNIFNLQKCASRMKVDMFEGIFPDNHVYTEVFDMGSNTKKINSIYEHMQDELARLDARTKNYKEHVFAIIMKARRMAEILKVPMLIDAIEDMFDEGLSPVLFVSFNDTIEAIKSRLSNNSKFKDRISYIVGGQSRKERDESIDLFQSDKNRLMIANLAAGNLGISLHDLNGKFPRSSLLVPSFSAINLQQGLGRIPRQGGKTKCVQRIVFSAGTIEERAAEKVQYRLDNLSTFNDGDLLSGINIYR